MPNKFPLYKKESDIQTPDSRVSLLHGLTIQKENNQHSNFAFLYGCKPAYTVDVDTTMVQDFVKTLMNKFDKNTLSVTIPHGLNQMKGKGVKFEMVTSTTI